MKIQIKTEFGKNSKVLIDGHDVGNRLTRVDVSLKADCIPVVKLELVPDEIEVEGDFEVLKKLPAEEHGTEIVINGVKVATDVKAEDLAKDIMKNLNKSSY